MGDGRQHWLAICRGAEGSAERRRLTLAFVREPEGNWVSERFVKTLKEQLLWVRYFATVEELRLALLEFKDKYNGEWLVEKHGHRTPAQVRADFEAKVAA